MLAASSLAAVALVAGAFSCRRGGTLEEVRKAEPKIEPYPSFFQAVIADDVYLFADLKEKQQFDVEPASLTYRQYISRTGERVFISDAQPDLVGRIAVGFERAADTELVPAGALGAPPADTPPPAATRRSLPTTQPVLPGGAPASTQPVTQQATQPATQPGTLPTDRLGPTGDPPPRNGQDG